MEFSVFRRTLLEELRLALSISTTPSRIAGEQGTASSFQSHIVFSVRPGSTQVSTYCTNLQTSLRTTFASRGASPSQIALPTRRLYDYVRLLPDTELTLTSTAHDKAVLRCGRSSCTFPAIEANRFPDPPAIPEPTIPLDPLIFRRAIKRTVIAASSTEERQHLNCIFLSLTPESTRLVGTDGYRLAIVEFPGCTDQSHEILIPKKAVDVVLEFMATANDSPFHMGISEQYVAFFAGRRVLSVLRPVATFPNYRGAVPADKGREVVMLRGDLVNALQHTSHFLDARKSAIRVSLRDGGMALETGTSDLGSAEEKIAAQFAGEEPLNSGFNPAFLLDFLSASESSHEVVLSLAGPGSTLIIRPAENNEGFSYTYLVAPCKN